MALEKSYDDKFGNTNTNAYHRIRKVALDNAGSVANIEVSVYKDSAAKIASRGTLETLLYTVYGTDYDDNFSATVIDPSGMNTIKAAYEYLKPLPEYSGAVDILESGQVI